MPQVRCITSANSLYGNNMLNVLQTTSQPQQMAAETSPQKNNRKIVQQGQVLRR
jgi:hypothetical protein